MRRFMSRLMPTPPQAETRSGKIKYALAAWLVGLPLPFILLALVFRGCDW